MCLEFGSYSRTEHLRIQILAGIEIDDTDWLERHTICHVSRILEFNWCVTSLSEADNTQWRAPATEIILYFAISYRKSKVKFLQIEYISKRVEGPLNPFPRSEFM